MKISELSSYGNINYNYNFDHMIMEKWSNDSENSAIHYFYTYKTDLNKLENNGCPVSIGLNFFDPGSEADFKDRFASFIKNAVSSSEVFLDFYQKNADFFIKDIKSKELMSISDNIIFKMEILVYDSKKIYSVEFKSK
ncbi:MAG TPA: hypothetical protein PK683_00135 [Leptospiraceae bacterium]|nr:hypothetical protein [Leptospiraceae bacterium]